MPQGNQLKMEERYKMSKYLEENWEELKLKTQADIALHLTEKFERTVSRQNVSSMLRMCGLKQEGQFGNTQITREVFVALATLTLANYNILSAEYEYGEEAINSVPTLQKFLGMNNDDEEEASEEAADE